MVGLFLVRGLNLMGKRERTFGKSISNQYERLASALISCGLHLVSHTQPPGSGLLTRSTKAASISLIM